MKTCNKCGVSKDETEFSKDKQTKDGLRGYCRACGSVMWKKAYAADPEYWKQRSKNWCLLNPEKTKRIRKHAELMHGYGLSLEDYEKMLSEQCGECAICDQKMNPPCVDHCHTTGKIRALLCSGCNTALGGFKDSQCFLQRAIGYLQKHST